MVTAFWCAQLKMWHAFLKPAPVCSANEVQLCKSITKLHRHVSTMPEEKQTHRHTSANLSHLMEPLKS